MMYGVPLVQQGPQPLYGDWTSLPIPNLHAIPLTTMHAVNAQEIHYLDQDGTPSEFRPLTFHTIPTTDTVSLSGLMGLGAPKGPKPYPTIPATPAPPIWQSISTGIILLSVVVVIGSAAMWAYSKMKK